VLVAAGAAVFLVLGTLHLVLTFRGRALHPRDAALKARLEEVPLVITTETTMWKTWIGFNASHSLGAMLFGLCYGYLALIEPHVLFASPFLALVGAAFVATFCWLGWRYWFSVPRRGIALAALLYGAGLATHYVQSLRGFDQ